MGLVLRVSRAVFLIAINGWDEEKRFMKKTLLASLASTVVIGLAPGVAMAAEIGNSGPGSSNEIDNSSSVECDVTNNNNVGVEGGNNQGSETGGAENDGNTTGGGAQSGNANNDNETQVDVDVDNGGCENEGNSTSNEGGKGSENETTTTTPKVLAESTEELPDTGASMMVVGAATAIVLGAASAVATRRLLNNEN